MRFAVADPPYPGKAHYYVDHPDYNGEVDHDDLIRRLDAENDGWALATSSEALPMVLSCSARHVRREVRIASWVRGSRGGTSAWPSQSWEAVVFAGGRQHPSRAATDDSLVHVNRPRTTDPARVIGAKPAVWWRWVFDLLGAGVGDTFVDMFPGSGGGRRAWDLFTSGSAASKQSGVFEPPPQSRLVGP